MKRNTIDQYDNVPSSSSSIQKIPIYFHSSSDHGRSNPKQIIAHSQHYYPKTSIFLLPNEILRLVAVWIADPRDQWSFSCTCKRLVGVLDKRDWFESFLRKSPSWSAFCSVRDLPTKEAWCKATLHIQDLQTRITLPIQTSDEITTATSAAQPHDSGINSSNDREAWKQPTASASSLCISMEEAVRFPADRETREGLWKRVGSPVYYTDTVQNTTIAASIVVRQSGVVGSAGGAALEHRILLYALPDLTNPIAICKSDLWTKPEPVTGRAWFEPFQEAQLQVVHNVELRHYPNSTRKRTVVKSRFQSQGEEERGKVEEEMEGVEEIEEMRVVLVLAFGEDAGPLGAEDNDMLILDVWSLIQAIELWIPASLLQPKSPESLMDIQENPHDYDLTQVATLGRVDRIITSTPQQTLCGRIAKLYSAPRVVGSTFSDGIDSSPEMVDCLALFGIQKSDASPAIVIKKILFQRPGENTWSKRPISRGVSCMTLFPSGSNFERLAVLFNKFGRGMIWDFVNDRQVGQLRMPSDRVLDEPLNPPGSLVVSQELYYWGVQVNWAIEVPKKAPVGREQRRSFRIVTLADGMTNEWESTWWHVDEDMLGGYSEVDLKVPTFTRSSSATVQSQGQIQETSSSLSVISSSNMTTSQEPDQVTAQTPAVSSTTTTPTSEYQHQHQHQPPPSISSTEQDSLARPAQTSSAPIFYATAKRYEDETLGHPYSPEVRAQYKKMQQQRKQQPYSPNLSISAPISTEEKEQQRQGPSMTQALGQAQVQGEHEPLTEGSGETPEAILFIAFVIWNRFRIGLTSRMGLSIMDMDTAGQEIFQAPRMLRIGGHEGGSQETIAIDPQLLGMTNERRVRSVDHQWVTFLDGSEDDGPLVDMATIGDSLVVTRRYSHLVWKMYGPNSKIF
ncbi:hypothetical protein BGW38_010989 [Lunasporangiospora selenospora]|uniref:F-box domain-containing protein n=1 Tax=Lunasporangiospora selenospora TaxID=979761 RepID=A0A9P6FWA0_9FUNG|nr:hypothetical protein BGW38_010989 [Lunasporangiospora selenospora]